MWQVALVLSILGTSAILIYIANSLNPESKIMQGLKFFFIGVALVLLVINSTTPIHILHIANITTIEGLSPSSAAEAELVEHFDHQTELQESQLYIIAASLIMFFVLVMIYIVNLIFGRDKIRGDDDFDG